MSVLRTARRSVPTTFRGGRPGGLSLPTIRADGPAVCPYQRSERTAQRSVPTNDQSGRPGGPSLPHSENKKAALAGGCEGNWLSIICGGGTARELQHRDRSEPACRVQEPESKRLSPNR